MIELRAVNAADAPQPVAKYAQAVEVRGANRFLFVSGQIPQAADGTVPAHFLDQARLVWRNVEAQLRAGGMSLDHLVKVTTYLSDRRHAAENRQVRMEVLGNRELALSIIVCDIFDEAWLLEVEAIAAA